MKKKLPKLVQNIVFDKDESVYLTSEEAKKLEERAKDKGLSIDDYVKDRLGLNEGTLID